MGDDISADWPDEEPDHPTEETDAESGEIEDATEAPELDESIDVMKSEPSTEDPKPAEPWTLPIRAAPILALQGESVTEFPLSQHLEGRESTSLVMDDTLMRIVEARYDPDGVRRLNVRMALVKEHISGYSHTHLDLFQKLNGVWWGAIGFGTVMATSFAQGLLALGGGTFVLAGVAGLLLSKLDLHRISFSDHGGRHDFYLSGWRQEPYLIHNSTALLGPAFVDFLRTGSLDTQHIDAVLDTMAKPVEPAPVLAAPPEPIQAQLPEPVGPPVSAALLPEPMPTESSAPLPLPQAPLAQLPAPPAPATSAAMPLPPPPVVHAPAPPVAATLPPPPVVHAPAPPVKIPPPPAALPPPPMVPLTSSRNVDEDALWDDLN
jgi:hypothetical protein